MSTRQRTSSKAVQPNPVIEPPAVLATPPVMGSPKQRVRIVRSEQSYAVGGAHYTLRAGETMSLDPAVASALIQSGRAVAEG